MDKEVKPYLDYLDKEMTIMGILSAFAVGAAGLVTREVLKVPSSGEFFEPSRADFYYISAGSGLMMFAAGCFYSQRAQLAWHFGQLSLWATDRKMSGRELEDILRESDSWSAWMPYQAGLVFTAAGLVEYLGAFLPIPPRHEKFYVTTVIVTAIFSAAVMAASRLTRDRKSSSDRHPGARRRLGKTTHEHSKEALQVPAAGDVERRG